PGLNTAAVAPVVDPECQSSAGYEVHRRRIGTYRCLRCTPPLAGWRPRPSTPLAPSAPSTTTSSSRRGGIATVTVVDSVTPKCHDSVDPPSDRSILRVSTLS
ncbi:hypothetical protein THAOC_13122, partial [Thalassiosira oceanica]